MKRVAILTFVCPLIQFAFAQNSGVGTSSPREKRDVEGNIRIRGGSHNPGNVLTAISTNGIATWGVRKANVAYVQTTANTAWANNDNWQILTGCIQNLSINFYCRVTTTGCATVTHNTKDPYRPDEESGNHDNYNLITYLDVWVATCTGNVNFRLEAWNTGDDAWDTKGLHFNC